MLQRVALVVLPLAALILGCASSSRVRQIRQTADGGTILVNGGTGDASATRSAVSLIEQQCRGVYEVVELANVQTGQTPSVGVSLGMGPVAVGTGGSMPLYGTSITYLCRPPQSTALNDSLIRAASADLVGRKCRADADCGPLVCARAAPSAETGVCAVP